MCVYIYIYICIYIYVYTCIYVCVYVYKHIVFNENMKWSCDLRSFASLGRCHNSTGRLQPQWLRKSLSQGWLHGASVGVADGGMQLHFIGQLAEISVPKTGEA